ncbi:MAG: ArsR/SmtB family transcription factor [Sulfurihydrogenibium sp.]|uniref:ArsR/SmtB family transcription factor n=3 Tax=Sulfurihydrogenibium sp. TaxID=2053621 RepID=UPI000CBF0CA9|nr:MAG: transcriptional regulator [Sulfurihydrogenibium sp.]
MEEKEILKTFYALSDPIRLKIVKMVLKEKEVCVCNFVEAFKLSQPRISFHLRILKQANILKSRKEGKWTYYSLSQNNKVLNRVLDIIEKSIQVDFENIKCEVKNG